MESTDDIRLNVSLLRRKVPNLTSAARQVGLRPATVSNLCTGKIPVGRAEVRTLVALASLADCSLDDLIIRGEKMEMIETKIKTLDLFAPLAKGGTVGLVARPGMGQLVVLAELLFRLKNDGFKTILLMPEGENQGVDELTENVEIITNTIEETYETIAGIGGDKDIMFVADKSYVITGGIQQLQEKLQGIGIHSVTTFLLDLTGEVVDEDLPYGPLETLLQFDADLAARHRYPAVNPLSSTSSVLEGAHLDQEHFTIQQKALKLLRRYRELRSLVNVSGIERIPASELQTYQRGERLEAYLTQPFYVAEPFTKQPGLSVSLQETLNDIKEILNGAVDSKDVSELEFIGKL
ncbi:ATP synthase subunit B [Bacillus sp. FJAT-18017]|uniref:ATP synthase beta subunit C-terminal domain-containing protein n=1 Tax=Bacillus sp. FJAT-18017 TaxID=1705566 RepID=UPI0006AE16B4|nr:helix-turn-helix domain-containing protein [Bacillus sp. FJAT-18017]ALC89290.1 ATP synthase subunit B [Bacillus sp. FJAT-18017]